MLVERHVLGAVSGSAGSARIEGRILCYHSVGQPECGVNDISPSRFRRQIERALRSGFRFVPAEAIAGGGSSPHDLAVTFDDATASCITNAAPILSEYAIPWTLFVVAGWSEAATKGSSIMDWSAIARLQEQGVTIASHSMTHPDFSRIAPDQVERELISSRALIYERLGILTDAFAIPLGQSKNWNQLCQASAMRAGYRRVYAQAQRSRTPGTIPRSFVTRFDNDFVFGALLRGAYDDWEEWY